MTTETILFSLLSLIALAGAGTVVFTRDTTRLALGLGAFLLAVAGYFALVGAGFLAIAWVFVYVGGVLILLLFAIMLVHRSEEGRPSLESRHDILFAAVGAGAFVIIVSSLWNLVPQGMPAFPDTSVEALSDALLGPLLPQFEAAGVLLLAGLLAVLVIVGGERE